MTDLQALLDRAEIGRVLVQYCRAVDGKDLDLLKDVYWPDATDDHGFFQGPAHQFAEWNVRATSAGMPLTQHHLTNVWIELDGDLAQAESCVLAFHKLADDDAAALRVLGPDHMARHGASSSGGHAVILGGRWLDRFERRDGAWRIAHRTATTHWDLAQPGSKVLHEGVFRATPWPPVADAVSPA